MRPKHAVRLPSLAVVIHTLLGALFSLGLAAYAGAQTSDELFDTSTLQEIRLSMDANDWAQFKANYLQNDYYPADLAWRGIVVKTIGVRHRGTGSRSGIKPYLGLKFDQYIKGQRFLGLINLRMKNSWQDSSFLHERLSMLLFRRMGIPAPREAYARLYVNDQYSGLYELMEEIDNQFLDRVFAEHGGCLYNYNWVDEYHFEYLGDDPSLYSPSRFEPKSCPADMDPASLVEMIRTVNESPDASFPDAASSFLDLKLFLKHVATDNFLSELDGILGNWGMNNFYLYRFNGTTRFRFIPWDKGETFIAVDLPVWYHMDATILTERIMEQPELSAAYGNVLRLVTLEAGGTGGWLEQELERAYAQIHSAALEDSLKPVDNATFEGAVQAVRWFLEHRKDYIIGQIGPLPPPAVWSGGVVNGGSFAPHPLAAGSIASIFGDNLGFTELVAGGLPLPATIDRTAVRVNHIPAPLFFVSPDQINFQVPWEMAGLSPFSLTVIVDGAASAPQEVNIAVYSPALFSVSQDGVGQGVILIAATGELAATSGSVPAISARPAHPGETVSIYCTGLGPVTHQPASGSSSSGSLPAATITAPAVTIGGAKALVAFSGLAGDSAGLYRVDVEVPTESPKGNAVPVTLTMADASSNTVTMAVE